jgi:hypothetical protein
MKILFITISMAIAVSSCGQNGKAGILPAKQPIDNTVPAELITDDSTFWTISTVSTIGYVKTTSGPDYNTYQSGGGMLVRFKFKKNNRFEFRLYVQANSYGTSSEAWTQVEGTVEFTKDDKGQNIFITKAEKGTYRTNRHGVFNNRPITESALKGRHSCTFLWGKNNS